MAAGRHGRDVRSDRHAADLVAAAPGQSPPRLAETPSGFVLATGDHNPGYRRVIDDHALDRRRLGTPIIMALAGNTPDDWGRLAAHLEEEPSVAGIERTCRRVAHRSDAAAWIGRRTPDHNLAGLGQAADAARGSPSLRPAPAPERMLW